MFLGRRATQVTNASGFTATGGGVGAEAGTSFPGPGTDTWVLESGTFVPGHTAGTLLPSARSRRAASISLLDDTALLKAMSRGKLERAEAQHCG